MKDGALAVLRRRAHASGVQTEFVDAAGTRRQASPETMQAMIELLGPVDPEPMPPVIVCWNARPKILPVAIAGRDAFSTARQTVRLSVALIDSDPQHVLENVARPSLPEPLLSGPPAHATLHIPPLPFGYYDLTLEVNGSERRALVISAPRKAYAPRGLRAWGVFAPMYALHSGQSWGAGDFSDWEHLCTALSAEAMGGRTGRSASNGFVAATLPLLGAFLDAWKSEPSPYSPATRLFWNEFYLDVTRVPEFAASRAAQGLVGAKNFQRALQKLQRGALVDYEKTMALKRRVLEPLSTDFFRGDSIRRREFDDFVQQHPELPRYAAFRAACEQRREAWPAWPARMRRGNLRADDYNVGTQRYFMFVQWAAQQQIEAVLARCRERHVKLYLDLPLGANPAGYDVWAHQDLFAHGASVGAPPDAFFTKGQDWGFPPLHPQRIRETSYRYVIEYLRFQMRHTGMLRLDHVMGLHRLWWVPRGAAAAEGAYVSYHAEELYAILCLESHRHQTLLVGENLGTVPPEVNRAMQRHGLRTMYVAQYEQREKAGEALRAPPRDCVASINTHDMPTWAAHWKGLDIADRRQLGLLNAAQARAERQRRARLRSALEKFLRGKKLLAGRATTRSVFEALLQFLARSDAEVVLVNLEDLWLETQPQNTPGTSTERVNWRRKTRRPLEHGARAEPQTE